MIALYIALSLTGLALVLFLVYLLLLIRPARRVKPDPALLCDYAHRGLHGGGVPENSLAAFELACREGFGIELDVQLSADGVVMVFHDYTLSRMTGVDEKLSGLSAAELQTLSLAGTDQTIPTFAQVLSLVGGRVPILVELKGENVDTSLCGKVAEQLSAYEGRYCLESFNPLLIGKMRKFLPDAFRGLLYTNVCRDKKKKSPLNLVISAMLLNGIAKPDFIAYNEKDRESFPVRLSTKFYSTPKFVWTVRTEEGMALAHTLGEHPIFERPQD